MKQDLIQKIKNIFNNKDFYILEEEENSLKISFVLGELSVQVIADQHWISVSIGAWHEMFDSIDDLNRLMNLLLNEKCRVEILSCGGDEYSWEFQVFVKNNWQSFSKVKILKFTLFKKIVKSYFYNDVKTKIVSEFNSIFGTIQFSSKFESDCELKTEIFTLKDLKNEELNCLESTYIIRFFVKNNSNEDKDIQLVAKLIDFNNDLIFDNSTGENLEAFSYENNEYVLHFGCPDAETLNHYNNNFQVSQVDNLVFVHQDNTFIVKYGGLKTRKEFYCHFIVAVKKKENNDDKFLSWKAVDQSKDILDEAVFNQTK